MRWSMAKSPSGEKLGIRAGALRRTAFSYGARGRAGLLARADLVESRGDAVASKNEEKDRNCGRDREVGGFHRRRDWARRPLSNQGAEYIVSSNRFTEISVCPIRVASLFRSAAIHMIRPLSSLLLLLLLSPGLRAESEPPLVDEFRRAELGAQGQGWSATQLRDGRLLFGSDALSLFDGLRWTVEPGPGRSYALRALDAADDGGFWIGGVNEIGYSTVAGAGFHYHSLTAFLPPEVRANLGDVWNVFATGPGRAVFVSTSYILQWQNDHFMVENLPAAPRLAGFRRGNRILIGHRATGLRELRDGKFETVLTAEQLHGAGVVWGGTVGGAEIYATTAGLRIMREGVLVPFVPMVDNWIRENILTCATSLSDGRIAVGTLKGGTMLVEGDGAGAQKLVLSTDISTDDVHQLFEDHEGCLWVVCATGLFRVWPTRAISVVHLPRATAYPVEAIAPLGDGALAASDNGIWRIGGSSTPGGSALYQLDGFHERIFGLVPSADSVLVAHRGGVSRVSANGTVALIHAVPSDVFAVASSAEGRLYIALNREILELSPNGITVVPGRLPDVATSMVALSRGSLIAGTYAAGAAVLGNSAPSFGSMTAMLAGAQGPTYVAGSDRCVFAARGQKVVLVTSQGTCLAWELPKGIVARALTVGPDADAWLASNRQIPDSLDLPLIYYLRIENGAISATPLRMDALHQLGGVTSLAAQPSDHGTVLWVGGESALSRIIPSQLPRWTSPQPPSLQLVAPIPSNGEKLLLPYQGNRLQLNIVSSEPDRRPAMRVQTRLEGTNAAWTYPQDQNGVALANLQDGHYRLQARFLAGDGSASDAAGIEFTVTPPWWRSVWALPIEFICAVLSVLGIVRLRFRNLRARAKLLEKLVDDRTQQLARASEAKSAFVSNVSHELRNPLNGLVASAQAFDVNRLDPQQRRLLGTVRHCADLLDAVIGDVLDMAEIESGTINLRYRPYQPAEIVLRVANIAGPIADRKGLKLSADIAPDIPATAYGDAFRVQQVLLNLAGNAVKYSETGEIKVTLRRAMYDDGMLEYAVRDQGAGISDEEKQRLFQKFSRLSSSRERNIPGTGLGLALCRELVERMGGSIHVISELGMGSKFYFLVPIGTEAAVEATPQTQQFAAPRTALIVEDVDYNAAAIVAILEVMACQGDIASTGAAALAALQAKQFDVVFIDYDLPDMTGPDLARAIIAAKLESPPHLIATTAYADHATRVRCRQSGMVDFIVKPVTRQKLRAVFLCTATDSAEVAPKPSAVDFGNGQQLDLGQLELLRRDGVSLNDAGRRLSELLESDVAELRQACEANEYATARSIAHRIVSHAHFVGVKGLALVAGEIERCARDEPELVADLLPSIEMQSQQVTAALRALQN
jgi:signal transduction histidine kinase/DNA-binding response OmpR family regulator